MGGSSVTSDWEFESLSSEVRTVVLVGRTGNGKSATGNSILGKKAFESKASLDSVTITCELQKTVLDDGRILNVIDAPGLFDFSAECDIYKEIAKCMTMSKDGIHAVLVVLSATSRFSREEASAILSLQNIFGPEIIDYMIVVFTGGDKLSSTLDDHLGRGCPGPLKEIIEMCGNRLVLFDNETKDEIKRSEQLKQLVSLVNEVVDKNGGKPFINELFVEVKTRAEKLHSEVNLEGCSEHEISEVKEKFNKSYEEQLLMKIIEMIESKMKETADRLEQQLAEEKAARLKAEAKQKKSKDEIRELKDRLDKAEKEAEEERNKKAESGGCVIL